MLKRSFIHVPGVGPRRELDLWRRGYTDWDRFLRDHPAGAWKDLIASRLDPGRVARELPHREAWRLLGAFPGRTGFLDIETEGAFVGEQRVTCIGLSDGTGVEAFVRGENLDDFPRALDRFELLVTYGGSCFDLPVLAAAFPSSDFAARLHVDLRYPARRIGLTGGLKKIERELGIERADEIAGADGYTAVLLWRAHLAGHPRARDTLVHYCLADVVGLKPLAAEVYNRLAGALPVPARPVTDVTMPEIPVRADRCLVRDLLRGRPGGLEETPPASPGPRHSPARP